MDVKYLAFLCFLASISRQPWEKAGPAAQALHLDLEVVGAAIHGVFDLDLPVGGTGLHLSPALVWGD